MPLNCPHYAVSILVPIFVLGYIFCDPFTNFIPLNKRDVNFSTASQGVSPTLPYNGAGVTELPAPASTLLQHIVVGRGIQNYSCSSPNSAPIALGAIATLFDITTLANLVPGTVINSLPDAVEFTFPWRSWEVDHAGSHQVFGYHYFDAVGTPTFNLSRVGKVFFGKKTAEVSAPTYALKGPAGTGAVDWLHLQDRGGSIGISETYRVLTVGGNPRATCLTTGVMRIPYAAEYWFYN